MITYWPSPAKINLFLYITGQLNNGYHTLQTLFQLIDYGDLITIRLRQDKKINLVTSMMDISNSNNLVIRAVSLLMRAAKKLKRLPSNNGVDIYINKFLPLGSGLGGSSTNAATVLVALNYLWKCKFSENELLAIGLMLGADVPVFIRGYTAFAEGIGELLLPVRLQKKWYLVIYPGISVSTKTVFKDLELPRNTQKRSIETLLSCNFSNDCEVVVRKHFQEVNEVFNWLIKYSTPYLTGTGACIFAKFDTEIAANQVLKKVPAHFRCFVAKSINISPLKKMISMRNKFQ